MDGNGSSIELMRRSSWSKILYLFSNIAIDPDSSRIYWAGLGSTPDFDEFYPYGPTIESTDLHEQNWSQTFVARESHPDPQSVSHRTVHTIPSHQTESVVQNATMRTKIGDDDGTGDQRVGFALDTTNR